MPEGMLAAGCTNLACTRASSRALDGEAPEPRGAAASRHGRREARADEHGRARRPVARVAGRRRPRRSTRACALRGRGPGAARRAHGYASERAAPRAPRLAKLRARSRSPDFDPIARSTPPGPSFVSTSRARRARRVRPPTARFDDPPARGLEPHAGRGPALALPGEPRVDPGARRALRGRPTGHGASTASAAAARSASTGRARLGRRPSRWRTSARTTNGVHRQWQAHAPLGPFDRRSTPPSPSPPKLASARQLHPRRHDVAGPRRVGRARPCRGHPRHGRRRRSSIPRRRGGPAHAPGTRASWPRSGGRRARAPRAGGRQRVVAAVYGARRLRLPPFDATARAIEHVSASDGRVLERAAPAYHAYDPAKPASGSGGERDRATRNWPLKRRRCSRPSCARRAPPRMPPAHVLDRGWRQNASGAALEPRKTGGYAARRPLATTPPSMPIVAAPVQQEARARRGLRLGADRRRDVLGQREDGVDARRSRGQRARSESPSTGRDGKTAARERAPVREPPSGSVLALEDEAEPRGRRSPASAPSMRSTERGRRRARPASPAARAPCCRGAPRATSRAAGGPPRSRRRAIASAPARAADRPPRATRRRARSRSRRRSSGSASTNAAARARRRRRRAGRSAVAPPRAVRKAVSDSRPAVAAEGAVRLLERGDATPPPRRDRTAVQRAEQRQDLQRRHGVEHVACVVAWMGSAPPTPPSAFWRSAPLDQRRPARSAAASLREEPHRRPHRVFEATRACTPSGSRRHRAPASAATREVGGVAFGREGRRRLRPGR